MFSVTINVRLNSKSLRSFRRSKAISGTQKVLAKGASLKTGTAAPARTVQDI